MLTITYKEIRTNTDQEWWHFTSEVRSWLEPFEQEMIDKGIMISCVNEISEDRMTFTRTSKFETREHLNLLYNLIQPVDYQKQRTEYNINHYYTWTSEEIES